MILPFPGVLPGVYLGSPLQAGRPAADPSERRGLSPRDETRRRARAVEIGRARHRVQTRRARTASPGGARQPALMGLVH